MNLKKKFILSSIALLTISFVGCFDDNDNGTNYDVPLLPKQIKKVAVSDAEPNYLYTYTQSFEYDNFNRPITITDVTSRTYGITQAIETVYSNTITLEYPETGAIIKRTDNRKQSLTSGEYERVETRDYYDLSTHDNMTIKIVVNGEEENTETIELNDKKQATKYSRDENTIYPSIPVKEEYSYDNRGNVSQYNYYSGEYHSANRYIYDNYNGIFKNLNVPQWFIVTLLDHEHLVNNAKKISVRTTGNTFTEYGSNQYRYNVYGYPIEKLFSSTWYGITTSKTTIEYKIGKQ